MTTSPILTLLLGATALGAPVYAAAQTQPAPATTAAAPVAAADTPALAEDDIVVTAQKRSENVQSVPINIMAFNGAALTQAGVTAPSELQRIAPSFKYTTSIGTLATRFSIRGIGTFGNSAVEPSVATFINGIYIPRPASIVNALLDVESVEVLSGPQGTLFGRNASAGALTFRTGTPTNELTASAKVDYSTGDHIRGEGVINVPLSDHVAVRVAGLVDQLGGYWFHAQDNSRFGSLNSYQGRVSVKADLAPSLVWNVKADYLKNTGDGVAIANLVPSSLTPTTLARLTAELGGGPQTLNQYSRTTYMSTDNARLDDHYWSASSDLSYTTDGDFTFRLLDGYNEWHAPQGDGDSGQLSVYVLGRNLDYRSKSNSHELQLISPKDKYLDGRLDFVGGLYYFHEDLGIRQDSLNGNAFCSVLIPLPALAGLFGAIPGTTTAAKIAACQAYPNPTSRADFNQATRSVAGYGQATFKLLPTLEVTGGIRYTDEEKTGSYFGTVYNPTGFLVAANETTPSLKLSQGKVTYRANIAWHPAHDVLLFATSSTGFKSGGFNNGVATIALGQNRIFQAETVKNYELGVKSQFLDRAVTLNLTGFRMDIDNFQERSIVNTTSTIRNVGAVRQQGFEFEGIVKPIAHLRFNAAVTYLDSKITSYANAPLPPFCPANLAVATANCPVSVGGTQNLAGARLNYTPKWSGVAGATVDGDFGASGITWTLNGDVNFTSSQKQGTTIDNGPLVQPAYALLNARFTVTSANNRYSLGVYGRNLANKGYCAAQVYQVLEGPLGLRYDRSGDGVNDGTAVRCLVGTPRVLGVTAGAKF